MEPEQTPEEIQEELDMNDGEEAVEDEVTETSPEPAPPETLAEPEPEKILGIFDSNDHALQTLQGMYSRIEELEGQQRHEQQQHYEQQQQQQTATTEQQNDARRRQDIEELNYKRALAVRNENYAEADRLLADYAIKEAKREVEIEYQNSVPQMVDARIQEQLGPAIVQHQIAQDPELSGLSEEQRASVFQMATQYGVPRSAVLGLLKQQNNKPSTELRAQRMQQERNRAHMESPGGATQPSGDKESQETNNNKSVMASWWS